MKNEKRKTKSSSKVIIYKDNNFFVVNEYVDDGYSGTNFNRLGFQRMISDIDNGKVNCAKECETLLYRGEYGVIDIVSPEDTLKWFKTINSVFEKLGIGRAAWNYKQMNFGLSSSRLDGIRNELIRYL